MLFALGAVHGSLQKARIASSLTTLGIGSPQKLQPVTFEQTQRLLYRSFADSICHYALKILLPKVKKKI